jgi:putative transposase
MRRLTSFWVPRGERREIRSYARLILHELAASFGYSPLPLLGWLIEDAQTIHKQRPILQETLATATQLKCED